MEYKRKLDGTADMRCVKKKAGVEESLGWVDTKELSIRTIETGKGSLLPDPAKRGVIHCRDRQVNIRHCLFGYKIPDTSSNLSEAAIFTSTRPILSFAICTNDVICTVVTRALLCGEDGTWPPYYFDLRHGEGLSNTAIHAVANKAADLYGNDGKVIMCKEITPVIQMMAEGLRRTVCQPTTALLDNEKETIQEFRFAVKNFAQEVNLRSPLAPIQEALLTTLVVNRLLISGLDSTGPGLWKYDQTVYVTGAATLTASSHMSLRTEQAVHVSLGDSGVAVDAIVKAVRLLKGEIGREEEWGDMPYFKPDATICNYSGQEVVSDEEADQRSDHSELSLLATTLPNLADGFGSEASAPRGMCAGQTSQSGQSAQRGTEVMSEEDRLRIQIAALNAKKAQSVNRLAQLASNTTFAPSRPAHSSPEVVDLFSAGESSSDPPPPLRVRAVSLGQPPSSTDTTATFITNPYSSSTGGLARSQSGGGVHNTTSHTSSLPQWMQEMRDTRRQPASTTAQPSLKPAVVPISPTTAPNIRRSSYKAPSTPTDSGRDSETEVAKTETVEPLAIAGTTTNTSTVSTVSSASNTTTTPTSAVNTSGSTNTTTPSTLTTPITTTVTTTNITPPPITTPTTTNTTLTTTSITNTTLTTTATPITTLSTTTNTPLVATKRTTIRAQKVAQTGHDGDNSHSDSSTTDPLTTGQPTAHKRPSIQSSWVKVKKRIVPFGSGVPVGGGVPIGGSGVSISGGSSGSAGAAVTTTTTPATITTMSTAATLNTTNPSGTTTLPVNTTTFTPPTPSPSPAKVITTATPSTTTASNVTTAPASTTTSSPATTTHTATTTSAATPSTSGITPVDMNTTTTSTASGPSTTTNTSASTATTLNTTTNSSTTTPTIDSMLAQYDNFPLKVPNIKEEVVLKDEILPLTTPITPITPITPYTSLFTPSTTTTLTTHTPSTPPTHTIHTHHAGTNIHMYTNCDEATERLVDFVEFSLSEQLQHDLHHLATPVVVHRGVARPAVLPAGAVVCVELNADTLSVGDFYNSVRGQLGLG